MQRLRFLGMFVFSIGLIGLTLACQPQAQPDTRAADEQAIRQALTEAWNAVAAKDVDKFISICADEDIMLPPNAPMVTGKQGVREYMSQLFATPGFAVRRQPPQVEVSRAGDLAYTWDTAGLTLNDPKGNPATQPMKHVVVWKKQADGTWKIVADIWNFDQPPPAAP
ncbi:MAG: YybH family protein [Terriglobia bacterium]